MMLTCVGTTTSPPPASDGAAPTPSRVGIMMDHGPVGRVLHAPRSLQQVLRRSGDGHDRARDPSQAGLRLDRDASLHTEPRLDPAIAGSGPRGSNKHSQGSVYTRYTAAVLGPPAGAVSQPQGVPAPRGRALDRPPSGLLGALVPLGLRSPVTGPAHGSRTTT
jgi:hypothetical protein